MTKQIKPPDNPADCITIAQKVAYSMMVREQYELIVCSPTSMPSDLGIFQDRFPYDERYPWSGPEWAQDWARRERAKRDIMRLLPDDE